MGKPSGCILAACPWALGILFFPRFLLASETAELPASSVQIPHSDPTELSTGMASVEQAEPYQGTGASLVDLLEDVPGVSIRRFGGVGSFASVSIRGLGPEHVQVVLDDLPLASATLGPVDLSLLPLESIERIEVYRGYASPRFDSPLGGVIRLRTKAVGKQPQVTAHTGVGSFLTRSAHVTASGPWGPMRLLGFAGYQGSRGDHPYYDDRETLYTAADDRMMVRANNAMDVLNLRMVGETDGPRQGNLRLTAHGTWRTQGIAGPGVVTTHRSQARQLGGGVRVDLSEVRLIGDRLLLGMGMDVVTGWRRFADPDREIGLRTGSHTASLLRSAADVEIVLLESLEHETELIPRLEFERYRQRESTGGKPLGRSRLRAGFGAEHRADVAPWVRLVPSVRFDLVADRGRDARVSSPRIMQVSPHLGLIVFAGPCQIRLNGGRFHRVPTLLERFGDGVVTTANADLETERGLSADLGASCRPTAGEPAAARLHRSAPAQSTSAWPWLRLNHIHLAGFVTDADRLVTFVPSSVMTMRAENLGRARIWGVEAALEASWWLARARLSYTFTRARDAGEVPGLLHRSLPGIPAHRAGVRLTVGPSWCQVSYELMLTSQSYLDRANLRPLPGRATHDLLAMLAHEASGLSLRLAGRNLSNRLHQTVPVQGAPGGVGRSKNADFLGYPLPGRTFFGSLSWRTP